VLALQSHMLTHGHAVYLISAALYNKIKYGQIARAKEEYKIWIYQSSFRYGFSCFKLNIG
jgi:hypothetical protein